MGSAQYPCGHIYTYALYQLFLQVDLSQVGHKDTYLLAREQINTPMLMAFHSLILGLITYLTLKVSKEAGCSNTVLIA